MVIIDIEVSSLVDGYPIEIGWARSDGECRAYLIRPTDELIAHTKWDPVSQSIHGISRELLEQRGMPIDEVVANLNRDLDGERILSDAPSHDWQWLMVLLEFSSVERFTFEMLKMPVDSLLLREANEHGIKGTDLRYVLEKQERAHVHAAAHDAASWAAAVEAISAASRGDTAAVASIFETWRSRATAAAPWRESSSGKEKGGQKSDTKEQARKAETQNERKDA